MIDKHKIERICRAAGMRPEKRTNIEGAEVFIADGFSPPPHFKYRKLGLETGDFPYGCYVTFWWAARGEDKLDTGQPLFFDALDADSRNQHARLNTAVKEATNFLKTRNRIRLDG